MLTSVVQVGEHPGPEEGDLEHVREEGLLAEVAGKVAMVVDQVLQCQGVGSSLLY